MPTRPPVTARSMDKRRFYELAVQSPEAEIDFVEATYRRLRDRRPLVLREDFCGTAIAACEFVRRRRDTRAVGLDLDPATLRWASANNAARLTDEQRSRLSLLRRDVRRPGAGADRGFDAVLAMNFSYWCFKTPEELRGYFEGVRRGLGPGGIFFLDTWGGFESMKEQRERRRIHAGGRRFFTYVWDQASFNPITCDLTCHIHFEFDDRSKINRAFTYHWRLWTIPQIRELLADAGFKRSTVYWEGEDGRGSGNGVFRASERGEADASFIAYLTAEK